MVERSAKQAKDVLVELISIVMNLEKEVDVYVIIAINVTVEQESPDN